MSVAFITDHQSSEVEQPANGAFNLPAAFVASKCAPILCRRLAAVRAVRANQLDSTASQACAERIAVCRAIIQQAWQTSADDSFIQEALDQSDLIRTGTDDVDADRQTLSVDNDHDLRAFAPFSLADTQSPFFAEANVPSAITSSQRTRPRPSSLRSNRAHTFWNTPDFVHSFRRRQQVVGEGKSFGRSFQRAPLLRIQTIPSRQGREGIRGRPPAGEGRSSANNSAIKSHCSSVICGLRSVMDADFVKPRRGLKHSVGHMRVSPFTRDGTHFSCRLPQ